MHFSEKLFFIYLCCISVRGTVALKSQNYQQLVQYRNKYVTTGTLWNHNVQSIYFCAIHCQNDIQCKSFFYGEIACSGYGELVPNTPDLTTLNGMEFYRKEVYCDTDYTFSNKTSICYKVVNATNSWTGAKQFCNDEATSLIVLDKADKIDVLKKLPDYLCNGVFVPIYNKCYWLTSTSDLWNPGKTTCLDGGGQPASFPDVNTYIYIVNALGINGSTNEVWIGVNDFNMDGVWKNYDQSNLAFYDYMYNYSVYGSWNDRDALAIIPTDNLLWWERNEYVTNLKMLCEGDIVHDYWVGGSDETNEGTWLWEDGQAINMSLFRTGEPNGNTAQNCLSLKFSSSGNQFEDEDCSIPKKFICQMI